MQKSTVLEKKKKDFECILDLYDYAPYVINMILRMNTILYWFVLFTIQYERNTFVRFITKDRMSLNL